MDESQKQLTQYSLSKKTVFPYDPSRSRIFDLGTHTLEVLDDQGVLLVDNTTGKEIVQLNEETTYLLTIVLHDLYQQPME